MDTIFITAGTYHSTLLGWSFKIDLKKNIDDLIKEHDDKNSKKIVKLSRKFNTKEHSGSISTIATYGKIMCTGGYDEKICGFDTQKLTCTLVNFIFLLTIEFTCE